MPELNYLAIVAAAVAAMVASTIYYIGFTRPMAELNPAAYGTNERPAPWKLTVELGRSLLVAGVVAGIVVSLGVTDLVDGLLLASVLWLGFPVVLLIGSVIWERVPPRLAAIHAGDWLIKLLLVAAIVVSLP